MAKNCLSRTDERFQELMLHYPSYNERYILDALAVYREQYPEKGNEYYPVTPAERSAFSNFLTRLKKTPVSSLAKPEMTQEELVEIYTAANKAFGPAERKQRVDMIAGSFLTRVRVEMDKHPSYSVKQAMDALGGFNKIMDSVFASYKSMTEDALYNAFKRARPSEDMEEANRTAARDRAEKFKKVVDNRHRLVALAASKLSDTLDIKLGVTGIVEVSDGENNTVVPNPVNNTAEQNTDSVYESENMELKGDRYVDFRLLKLNETLSSQVKIILESVREVDDNGNPQSDDMGMPKYVGYEQAAMVLVDQFVGIEPKDFMPMLESLCEDYPWLNGVVKELTDHPEFQAPFYANLKRARVIYEGIIYDAKSKKYAPQHVNRMSGKRGLHRNAGNNVQRGSVLSYKYRVYGPDGSMIMPEDKAREITEELNELKKPLSHVVTTAGKDFSNSTINKFKAKEPWIAKKNKEAAELFLASDGVEDWLKKVSEIARGVGMEVTPKKLKVMLKRTISKKSARFGTLKGYNNRLSAFIDGLSEAYDKAATATAKKQNASWFLSVASNAYKRMNDAIAVSLGKELDRRALVGNKSLSTNTAPNLLHDMFDEFTNVLGKSRTHVKYDDEGNRIEIEGEYEKNLRETVLECEGYAFDYVDENGKVIYLPTGWLKDWMDDREYSEKEDTSNRSEYKGPVSLHQETEFNGIEYAKMSDDQARLSCFLMWYFDSNAGKTGKYQFLIESDYTNAWDFVKAAIYPTGRTVDEIAAENVGNTTSPEFKAERQRLIGMFGSTREPLSMRVQNEDGTESIRYNTESEIVKRLADEVALEYQRILAIRERENEPHVKLSTYEANGKFFCIFPELNYNGFEKEYVKKCKEDPTGADASEYLREQVAKQLVKVLNSDIQEFTSGQIYRSELLPENSEYKLFEEGKNELSAWGRDVFQQFSLNLFYARHQMSKIFMGGTPMFKNIADLEKRAMFMHSPGTPFYTEAEFNGEKVGKETDRVVYIDDDKIGSKWIKELTAIAKKAKESGLITDKMYKYLISQYKSIKTTDGQGFRTLESHRRMRIESAVSQWTDAHEQAYQRIMNYTPQAGDFELVLDDEQAYNSVQKYISTGYQYVPAAKVEGGAVTQKKIRVPLTHKYSEAVLLPPQLLGQSFHMSSEITKAFNKLNEKLGKGKGVDLFLFSSNVKTGLFASMNPMKVGKDGKRMYQDADAMADHMYEEIQNMPEAIHEVPVKFTRVTASMPPHVADAEIAYSSQAYKHATANIDENEEIKIPGRTITAKELRDLVDNIETAIIAEAHERLESDMMDPVRMRRMLQEALATKSYNSDDMGFALTQVEGTGGKAKFAIPLFSASVKHNVQELINSVFKKRLSSVYTKGAGVVQVSSIGLDQDSVPFTANDKYILDDKDKLGIEFEYDNDNTVEIEIDGKKEKVPAIKRVKWIDCYISIHDSRLLKYAEPDGSIPPAKLRKLVNDGIIDERILYVTAYRNPADAEHSILPLKIKGFLPAASGANIIVAKEAMKMTGHDYDGDKLRCHFQEFFTFLDKTDLIKAYRNNPSWSDVGVLEDLLGEKASKEYKDGFVEESEFVDWVNKLKKNNRFRGRFTKTHLVEYDYSASPLDPKNGDKAKRNAINQLLFAAVTSESGSQRLIFPGGADESDWYAKTIEIVRNLYSNPNLLDLLAKSGIPVEVLEKGSIPEIYNAVLAMSPETRDAMFDSMNALETPFSFSHAIKSYKNMMAGTQMTSVYAMYSSTAALLQRLNLAYRPLTYKNKKDDEEKTTKVDIYLFGRKIDRLFRRQAEKIVNGKTVKFPLQTLIFSRFLHSAVDNGKNPILGMLNQYTEMAGMTFFLYAAGVQEEEIHLIMNQPAMIELVQRLRATDSQGFVAETDKMMQELQEYALGPDDKFSELSQVFDFNQRRNREEYIAQLPMTYTSLQQQKGKKYAKFQLELLSMIRHLNVAAVQLDDFVHVVRPETRASGVGPTNAATTVRISKLDDLRDLVSDPERKKSLRISGMEPVVIDRDIHDGMSNEEILAEIERDTETTGQLRQVVARNELLLRWTKRFMGRIFPDDKADWTDFIVSLAKEYDYASIQEGIVEKIGEEAILYAILDNREYQKDLETRGKDIVIDFPKRLMAFQDRVKAAKKARESYEGTEKYIPEDAVADSLIDNMFLDRIVVNPPESEKSNPRISFVAGGPMVANMSEDFKRAWSAMMQHEDKEIRNMAIDLFEYNLLTSGLGFGMYEFMHFAPMDVILADKRYLKAAESVMNYTFTEEHKENFRHQYYMNHWGESRLVPRYKKSALSKKTLEALGLKGKGSTTKDALEPNDFTEPYIVITQDKGDMLLFRRVWKGEGFSYEPAEKLGVKTAHGQMSLYYNPEKRYDEIKPIQTGVDSSWGSAEQIKKEAERRKPYSRKKAKAEAKDFQEGAKEVAKSVHKQALDWDERIKKFMDASRRANEANNDDSKASATEEVVDNTQQSSGERNMPSDRAVDTERIDKIKKSGTFKWFSIARRKGNDTVIEQVPATPENVIEARKQRVYVELNEILRDLLRKAGVATGVLDSFESRLAVNGVTDFDTANVTAEGLYEMIRLREGIRGEYALPEEFAHLGLEMLGHNHPLVARLLSAVRNSGDGMREAFEDLYDEYVEEYEGNAEKLAIEAAGKLVAKKLFLEQEISTSPLRRIVHRVVDAIKYFLSRFSADEVKRGIYEANRVASKLAQNMLSGRLVDQMSLGNIDMQGILRSMSKSKKDISGLDDILNKLLQTEMKRLQILGKKKRSEDESDPAYTATENQIAELKQAITLHKTDSAVVSYLAHTVDYLIEAEIDLNDVITKDGQTAESVCRRVYSCLDTIASFATSLEDIRTAIRDGELSTNEELEKVLANVESSIGKFKAKCIDIASTQFENALSEVYGEHGLTQTIGRDRGKNISIREMSRRSPKDISMLSRWVHSAADCNDLVLKAASEHVRKVKEIARRKTLEVQAKVDALMSNLVRETGSRDQTFMFKYDDKGNKTGKYITAKQAKLLPKAQKDFYFGIMKVLKNADALLPEGQRGKLNIIMVRKFAMERALQTPGVGGKLKAMWEAVKDSVLDTSDDANSPTKEVSIDFNNNRVDSLPILYTKKGKNESYNDMTDDVAMSALAYAGMANEYSELDSILGKMEIMRYMAARREVGQKTGARTQQETISDDNTFFSRPFTRKQAKSYMQEAFNDFMTMHFYGHTRADEGNFGNTKLSKQKVVGMLNSFASLQQMAFNLPQRISNVTVGLSSVAIESAAKGFFNAADVSAAIKEYLKYSPDRLFESGSTDQDNYISLWRDRFDISQDNGREFKRKKYGKSRLGRTANGGILYAGLTVGEDFLSTVTSIAVARNFKVKDADGNVTNLYNAYEKAYKDPVNKSGAYLKLKDGYTKEDGSPITQEDEYRFSKVCAGLSFDLQGIYNLNDRSAMQQYAGGSLLIMYRKWIAPAMKRRYAGVHYDILRDEWEEGYWSTTGTFFLETIKSMKEDSESLLSAVRINWDKMTDYEKSNMKKAATEFAILMGTVIACAALNLLSIPDFGDDDEEREVTWIEKQFLYHALRLRNELGAQAPTPMMAQEAMKILKSPVAAMRPLAQAADTFNLLIPTNYFEKVKTGRYAGRTKAYKYFNDLPVIAMWKHINNFIDPTSSINYYKNPNF